MGHDAYTENRPDQQIDALKAEIKRLKALAPESDDERVEYDDDGHLDEIVVNSTMFHMECMGRDDDEEHDVWWIGVYRADGTRMTLSFRVVGGFQVEEDG